MMCKYRRSRISVGFDSDNSDGIDSGQVDLARRALTILTVLQSSKVWKSVDGIKGYFAMTADMVVDFRDCVGFGLGGIRLVNASTQGESHV